MVASSIAVAVQLIEIIVVARAQRLIGKLFVPESVDKASVVGGSAVARERVDSGVVGKAL